MKGSGRKRESAPTGLAAVGQVLNALENNRRQLQHNVEQAAARLPFASIASGGISKALPSSAPAVLAAAAAGIHNVATAQQEQQQAVQGLQDSAVKRHGGVWRLLRPGGGSPEVPGLTPAAPIAEVAAAAEAKTKDPGVVCVEYTKGKRRVYRQKADDHTAASIAAGTSGASRTAAAGAAGAAGFEIVDDVVRHRQRIGDALADYLLPQGYPHSVAPQYSDYMFWRGVQYFFGGAISVFTTRSLLSSLGVANKRSSEAAAAINWVLKDGAGRMGRFLFARWGRELDCELKQFRLAGDVLMETGAALELSTVLMPRWFLPLACTANLAKNLAAVAASSTRAPIYRTFAKQNNLADVTAKGESVANLADVVGTAFGIALAKANLPVLPTFVGLSLGYLISSRREVDSVVLPYLNRARLSYAARRFYNTGVVPAPLEANECEPLMPWSDPHNGRVVLGATVAEACPGPQQLQDALANFAGRQYSLTYRPDTRKCYVLLKQGASQSSVLQAAMDAHALLWMLDQQKAAARAAVAAAKQQPVEGSSLSSGSSSGSTGPAHVAGGSAQVVRLRHAALELGGIGSKQEAAGSSAAQEAVRFVATSGRELHQQFEKQAEAGGWRMHLTMLNPKETRLAVS